MKSFLSNKYFVILKVALVLIFLILIAKFLIITIYYSEGFSTMAKYQTKVILANPMPRGEIFDRNGKLIVGNKQTKNLVYLNNNAMSDEEEWNLAEELNSNLDLNVVSKNINEIDYQDLVIREEGEEIQSRIDYESGVTTQEEIDEMLRAAVKTEDIEKIKKEHGDKVVDTKIKISASSTSSPQTLAEDLSKDDQYYVTSNVGKIGGAFIIDNWERDYPYKRTMRSTLGDVGPIPEEKISEYKARGYSAQDSVGTGYIEKNLESTLKSEYQQYQIYFDDEGNISDYTLINSGKEGMDIKLTVDVELQRDVENILKKYLKNDSYPYFRNAFSSIIDPKTGEVLVLGGIQENGDEYYDLSIGQFTTAYEVGSIVKPGVLLMGYDEGWKKNKVIVDAPFDMGGVSKGSYLDFGAINEYRAIQVSSNVYFYDILLNMAGIDYTNSSTFPATVSEGNFRKVRNNFQEMGLGSSTGISFSEEITGVTNSSRNLGLYMDLANGQYDTYTPLQATQFMGTLANGENRMKLNYLKSVHEPGDPNKLGATTYSSTPEIINKLNFKKEDIKHVQDTLAMPAQGGTTAAAADPRYSIGSKSGTSESFFYEKGMKEVVKTDNSSFMAYAPYKDPQIAVSVLFPYWTKDGDVGKASSVNAGGEILKTCYERGYIKK